MRYSQLSLLFLLFLVCFLLIGLYPAWKRQAPKLRRLLRGGSDRVDSSKERPPLSSPLAPAIVATAVASSTPLDSYELLLLKALARQPDKGRTRRQLQSELHLQPESLRRTLRSLGERGLLGVMVTPLLGVRFLLSARGRTEAAAADFIPRLLGAPGGRRPRTSMQK